MENLSFQDAFFLRAETTTCPYHVASLMVFSPPENAPANYLKQLAKHFGQIHKVWPVFQKCLKNPNSKTTLKWVVAEHYAPEDHVLHYRLPEPGRFQDLLTLVSRAHEQHLDRSRPLWQVHVIEGLPKNRFAVYFKVHHALIDGVGAIRLMQELLSPDPDKHILDKPARPHKAKPHTKESLSQIVSHAWKTLLKQSKALPEAYGLLANLSLDNLLGKQDVPQMPFAAPHTRLNTNLSSRRRFVTSELSLTTLKQVSTYFGGTINDVLVSICGGALREYLGKFDELPDDSLESGLPVSVKSADGSGGNQLSFIICPLGTNQADPEKRLKHIIRVTKKAKKELAQLSPEANEGLATLTMIPFLAITLTNSSQRLPPVFNTIISNVPGPKKKLYLEGALLEHLYPLSIVTDGMGLNITAISYRSKLCLGITCAPENEPHIERLGKLIENELKALKLATQD